MIVLCGECAENVPNANTVGSETSDGIEHHDTIMYNGLLTECIRALLVKPTVALEPEISSPCSQ